MGHEINNSKRIRSERSVFTALAFLLVITIVMAGVFIYVKNYGSGKDPMEKAYSEYKLHYMLITGQESDFHQDFYEGAREAGKEKGILVENLNDALGGGYSVGEQLEIAIAAKVDGIIVEADESEETKILIDKASTQNIPVVTIWQDSYQSKRKCFVGNNEYQLGELYGKQVLELAGNEGCKVTILMDYSEEAGPNMIYSGIKDTVPDQIEINTIFIDRKDEFSSEETIRSLAVSDVERPDILICLNSIDTLCARLVVVDYNIVGQMQILGYYSSDDTLEAIDKEIIAASVTMDTKAMGQKSVDVLYTYRTNQYVSEYETVEAHVITKENLGEYRPDKGDVDEKQ